MANKNWIAKARASMERKGTVGAFRKQAEQAGMSTLAYARKVLASDTADTKTKRRALFALNATKGNRK